MEKLIFTKVLLPTFTAVVNTGTHLCNSALNRARTSIELATRAKRALHVCVSQGRIRKDSDDKAASE